MSIIKGIATSGSIILTGSGEELDISIDTDIMELSYSPVGYTPAVTPETNSISQLSAHLKGISDKLADIESRID